MSAYQYPDLFNDVFGPVMQPGSSSHTAGPCRLGYLAHCLLQAPLKKITVVLDPWGSFSGTFGHTCGNFLITVINDNFGMRQPFAGKFLVQSARIHHYAHFGAVDVGKRAKAFSIFGAA